MNDDFKTLTIPEIIVKCSEIYCDSPALTAVCGGKTVQKSFVEFRNDCAHLSNKFHEMKLTGKYIVIDADNDYETVVAVFAAMMCGSIAFPFNFDLPDDIIEYVMGIIKPSLFICHEDNVETAEGFDCFRDVSIMPVSDICVTLEDRNKDSYICSEISQDSPALIILTSGTTSKPKLVLHSHKQINPGKHWWPVKGMSASALYHMYGFFLVAIFLCAGGHLMLTDVRHCIENINAFKPSELMGTPSFLTMLMRQHEAGIVDFSNLKTVMSCCAPANRETLKKYQAIGVETHDEYGSTETGTTLGIRAKGGDPEGSVGYVQDEALKIDNNGEVLVDAAYTFIEYIGNPEATKEAIGDGWFHTGDIGKIVDGFLFITGRIKNVIILSNGENVSPESIEDYFYKFSFIDEVIVKGSDDDIIEAHIYPLDGNADYMGDIQNAVKSYNKTVPSYYKVGRVILRDKPFEKNATNKILRNKI